ncbi:MAG: hypothetical protein WCC06_06915 [Candidatus Aminicenantales bacterium]
MLIFQRVSVYATAEIFNLLRENFLWNEAKILELLKYRNKITEFYIMGAEYEQMIDGVDEFYKYYANKNIPIFALASVACRRVLEELDQNGVDQELKRLRSKYSQVK